MAEIRRVKLSSIDANPFRNEDEWPTLADKVAEIRESYQATGFWAGYLIVRRNGKRYEAAFGHHRLVAAKDEFGDDGYIQVTVDDLDDEQMFKRMAAENSETYGQKFYYAVMQPIAALVKAYAEGAVELEKPEVSGNGVYKNVRYAPTFKRTTANQISSPNPYNATTVARYLGWTVKLRSGDGASERVLTALSALELIEKKVLVSRDLQQLSQTEVQALVRLYGDSSRVEAEAIEDEIERKEEELQAAEEDDDTNKAERIRGQLNKLEGKVSKAASQKVKQAARALGESNVSKVMEEAGYKVEKPVKEAREPRSERDEAYGYLSKRESTGREDERGWTATLSFAKRAPKFRQELYEELERAIERLKNRRKELA